MSEQIFSDQLIDKLASDDYEKELENLFNANTFQVINEQLTEFLNKKTKEISSSEMPLEAAKKYMRVSDRIMKYLKNRLIEQEKLGLSK